MTKGKTTVEIVIDSKGAITKVRSLDKASGKATKGLTGMGKAGGVSFLKIATGAGVAVVAFRTFSKGVDLAVDALRDMVFETADLGDNLAKMSKRLGVSIELLSEMRLAAALGGTDVEKLGVGLRTLAKNALDASNGTGEATDAFRRLGIQVVDANGTLKTQRELLFEVADRFSRLENGTLKTALAQRIFGRSGTELIPVLNEGRDGLKSMADEARRLGIVIDAEAGAKAEQFNDSLVKLGFAMEGFKLRIGNELIPPLTAMAESLLENEAFMESLKDTALLTAKGLLILGGASSLLVATQAETLKRLIILAAALPTPLQRQLGFLEAVTGGVSSSIIALDGIQKAATTGVDAFAQAFGALNAQVAALNGEGGPGGPGGGGLPTLFTNMSKISTVRLPGTGPTLLREGERDLPLLPRDALGAFGNQMPQVNPQDSVGSIFGGTPDDIGFDPGRLGRTPDFFPSPQVPDISEFQTFSEGMNDILGNLTDSFGLYGQALDSVAVAFQLFATGQQSFGAAFRQAVTATLGMLAKDAAGRALFETAVGIAALTPFGRGLYGDPSKHFLSAAKFGLVAGVAGGAALAVGGGQGGPGVGERGGPFNPVTVQPAQAFDIAGLKTNQNAGLTVKIDRLGSAVQSLEGRLSSMSPEDVLTVAAEAVGGLTTLHTPDDDERTIQVAAGFAAAR